MGRTASVTFEMVATAAQAMQSEGLAVTTRAVRERLGSTGSQGTINNHLQQWKAQQGRISNTVMLPAALQQSILEFMETELARARQTLETTLCEQQREMAELASENERQFAQLEENAQTLESLRNEIAMHQGRSGQLETELATIRQDAARERTNAETARTELAKSLLRLEAMPRLEADLSAARLKQDAERSAKVAAEQAAAVSSALLEASSQRIQELIERLAKCETNAQKMQEKLDAVSQKPATKTKTGQGIKPGAVGVASENGT